MLKLFTRNLALFCTCFEFFSRLNTHCVHARRNSEQDGVEVDRRLAMSGLRRRFILRRRRRRQRLHRRSTSVVVQVVSGRTIVVDASANRLDAPRRQRRRRQRRQHVAESVDTRSTRHYSRRLSGGASHSRRSRLVLRRRQSLASQLMSTVIIIIIIIIIVQSHVVRGTDPRRRFDAVVSGLAHSTTSNWVQGCLLGGRPRYREAHHIWAQSSCMATVSGNGCTEDAETML